jgi:pimeloyl-ACP methyl ester carboxylesterase
MSDGVEPFEFRADDADLEDLAYRLARTRFADPVAGEGWEAGIPMPYLRELVGYWTDTFDWRAQEARFNGLPHFVTSIDGQSIHFVHVRSPHEDALPVVLVHGWPGSFLEFWDVIPRLTDPTAFGGQAQDACHVVVPSLPGYGFSEPPRTPGWDVARIAGAFAALMGRLGYDRYGAQGGDWGAQVTTRIGILDPEHCVGLHLNMPLGSRPSEPDALTEAEQADLADLGRFARDEGAYATEQGTKPQTVGVGLDDSPAGLLAWIVEKFRGWSDCGGDPESCFTRDQLLANVTLYWLTRTATSSARLYWETNRGGVLADRLPFVGVPTGVGRYPKEVLRWPRSWVERQYNVTRWTDMPNGGHFAAMEQPELFADDVVAFFRTVR